MLQAILFDIDGTLIDSNALHVRAWREAFRHFGKELTVDEVHHQIGKGGDQLIPVFCTPKEIERFGMALEHYRAQLFTRKYLAQTKPFPGARALMQRMKADGLLIALASSSKAKEVEHHVHTLDVQDLVDVTTSADDVEHSKPRPDIFRAALDALPNVQPSNAIVIGDTPYDAIAAQGARLRTIGVLSGGFGRADLEGAGAIEIRRDVADLLAHYDDSVITRERRAS